ncbi:uncharacterized protein LOC114748847 [Neltuma alba]|uniref:uncharacterized protein LOC114748847 n=1 Tax=Neltuma alba TaxID=207710 RepID=UPI0010A49BFF|nr:uncharacterized protein LOC114748847 [Prosopis alba]
MELQLHIWMLIDRRLALVGLVFFPFSMTAYSLMKVLIWNVRGASKGLTADLRDFQQKYKLDMVAIVEPRISGSAARKKIKSWGFNFSLRIDANGFSGGIWLMWNLCDIKVVELKKDEQFLHCRVLWGGDSLLLTIVYGSPNEQKRQALWQKLKCLEEEIDEPWFLARDFNEIKSPLEQKGGGRINENCFNDVEVRVGARICSYHHPPIVDLYPDSFSSSRRIFRYQAAWQMHEQFKDMLKDCWEGEDEAHSKLQRIKQSVEKWNRDVFGRIEKRKRRLMNRLHGIQISNDKGVTLSWYNLREIWKKS